MPGAAELEPGSAAVVYVPAVPRVQLGGSWGEGGLQGTRSGQPHLRTRPLLGTKGSGSLGSYGDTAPVSPAGVTQLSQEMT